MEENENKQYSRKYSDHCFKVEGSPSNLNKSSNHELSTKRLGDEQYARPLP